MKPTEAEFRVLWDALSQSTLDELTACPIIGLGAFFVELKAMRGFAASRLYFSKDAIQEILHLNSGLKDIFERWINSFFVKK
jgi:hypothetical protein